MRDVALTTCVLAVVTFVTSRHPATNNLLVLPAIACVCMLVVASLNLLWERKP
jgi:hypothetical protein